MLIQFYKYQGAGNDFILLDNREQAYASLTTAQVRLLCDRRFGIGADGLMTLDASEDADFAMSYFNADGREGSLCGNGGRCLTAFAAHLGIVRSQARFRAVDGIHEAVLRDQGEVDLKMMDVRKVERGYDTAVLDTGSPHYVKYVDRLDELDVVKEGRKIRYSEQFARDGINVNFVEYGSESLHIRTYERGVEDETLACGTGITAAAIVAAGNQNQPYRIPVRARGGNLEVRFAKKGDQEFTDIWLRGPAVFVYEGKITLPTTGSTSKHSERIA